MLTSWIEIGQRLFASIKSDAQYHNPPGVLVTNVCARDSPLDFFRSHAFEGALHVLDVRVRASGRLSACVLLSLPHRGEQVCDPRSLARIPAAAPSPLALRLIDISAESQRQYRQPFVGEVLGLIGEP